MRRAAGPGGLMDVTRHLGPCSTPWRHGISGRTGPIYSLAGGYENCRTPRERSEERPLVGSLDDTGRTDYPPEPGPGPGRPPTELRGRHTELRGRDGSISMPG